MLDIHTMSEEQIKELYDFEAMCEAEYQESLKATCTVTVYQQCDHTYCQDCKPHGSSTKSTLVVSGYTVCCKGCGEAFKDIAEKEQSHELRTRHF